MEGSSATSAVPQEIAFLLGQVRDLLARELFASAEILGSLVLARSGAAAAAARMQQPPPGTTTAPLLLLGSYHAESLELYGDALASLGEHRRAMTHYERAEKHRQLGRNAAGEAKADSLAAGRDDAAGASMSPELALRFKQYKCRLQLGDTAEALHALSSLPPRQRASDPTVQAALGGLYRRMGLPKDAITAYKGCLEHHPLALEALVALAELGMGREELWALVAGSTGAEAVLGGLPSHVQEPLLAWLEALVAAHAAMHAGRHAEAAQRFADLERLFFPGSSHCALLRARMQIEQDQLVEAQATFARALEADGQLVDLQDYFAVLLRQKGAGPELTALARRLMDQTGGTRPEAWVAMSLQADLRGDKERAVAFIDKALSVAPSHVLAYHVKGTLLLAQGREEAAAAAFIQASALRLDIYSCKGLVDAYLAQHKFKEALSAAKEALSDMPKNAKAITLVGRVLSHLPEGRDKAKRAFQKALAIDPLTIDAALGLADLHIAQGDWEACAALLRETLDHAGHDFLWSKLGECHTLAGDYSAAMEAFHAAISANPASPAAAAGLERLERLMRGMDPEEVDDGMGAETEG